MVLEKLQLAVVDKIQRFKFGGDGDAVEASFAVTLPVQIGDAKTWIEAFVVPGKPPQFDFSTVALSIDVL